MPKLQRRWPWDPERGFTRRPPWRVEYEIHRAGYRVGRREPTMFAVLGYVVRPGELIRGGGRDEPSFLIVIEATQSGGLDVVAFRQSTRFAHVSAEEERQIIAGALDFMDAALADPEVRRELRRGAQPLGRGKTPRGFLSGFEGWV